jgi:O-antigen/teichoic acid export membrane protein
MIKSFIKDMVKYMPAQIIPAIVGIVSIPIITRLFPPGDYGNYVLIMATIGVLSTLVGWLSMSIIRFYPIYKRDGKLEQFYANIIKLSIISIGIISLIFSTILLFTKSYISSNLYFLMWIGILIFILTSFFEILLHFLRAKQLVSCYSAFKVWESITRIGFAILLIIVFNFGIVGLLWGSILSLTIALPFLWKKGIGKVSLRSNISIPFTLEMARYSFPLLSGNLAAWILSLSDRYILEFFRGSQEVGIYSASYAVSEKSIMLLATLFMLASGPISINIWEKEGKKKSQEFVIKLTRYYLIICFPAMIGLSALARPVIRILTAQEYYEGYRIIPLVALGAFFLGLQQIFQAGPIFYKKTNFVMYSIIASCLLNLGLNFLLVPKYGYVAAAITTLISYVFLLLLMIVISRKIFIWEFPFKSLIKVVCASGVMGIVVYLVGSSMILSTLLNLIIGIIVGVVVYLLMLFLLREIRPSEIQAVLDLKNQIFAKNKL